MNDNTIQSIVIVGGGTAGWITAGRIAAEYQALKGTPSDIKVTLVESPNVPAIGVGEGTWPTMRATLQALNISETDFIRECDATFKQGAKFAKWVTGTKDDFYYHPLMIPQGFPSVDLAPHWVNSERESSFSNSVCFQESLCERGLAPKQISTPEFASIANYSYHLDAGKFSKYLQKHCTSELDVEHVLADVIEVGVDDEGYLTELKTEQAGHIAGDLFIDCTGFKSLLLGEHYKVPFNDCSDCLQVDNALAIQVPYESSDSPIACHTISTAQSAGWVWDIGLRERRGIGHVYSSEHISHDEAEHELRSYVGDTAKGIEARRIPIKSGYREKFWHKNCVAIGLSAGFLEPLEASAIVLVELSATMLAEQLPRNRRTMNVMAKRFNETFKYRWERIVDFLKLHYILTQRQDAFWLDMCKPETIPKSLADLLELWKYQSPSDADFTSNNEVFPAASYQYVLYGMAFQTAQDTRPITHRQQRSAEGEFSKNKKIVEQAVANMPSHRDLIDKIHQYGFQQI